MGSLEIKENINMPISDYFIQKKIETVIDINNKKVAAEISALRDAIKQISEELISLKGRIGQRNAEITAKSPQDTSTKASDLNCSLKKSDEKAKPRYGDYTPEDVAINKIFYFGRK